MYYLHSNIEVMNGFYGCSCRSVNIVDYNDEYLDEHFKDTESILYYNYQELNSLDRIETLYKNTELLEFMSHNARNVILSGHLWLHRAQQ